MWTISTYCRTRWRSWATIISLETGLPSQHCLPHITGHHYPDLHGYLDEIDGLDQVDDLDVDGCGDRCDQHGEKHWMEDLVLMTMTMDIEGDHHKPHNYLRIITNLIMLSQYHHKSRNTISGSSQTSLLSQYHHKPHNTISGSSQTS